MRKATLLFLVKRSGNEISEICLAMKKRGFGAGRWNGTGGKVAEGETVEDAARRETHEEIGIKVGKISPVAELSFTFPHNSAWNQMVHVYLCEAWEGEPTESEEMAPKWFEVSDIPYSSMWPDDSLWLPRVLAGEKIKASFTFGENDSIMSHSVSTI